MNKKNTQNASATPASATPNAPAIQMAAMPTVGFAATGKGFEEGCTREELMIPRAQLVQPTSPILSEGRTDVRIGSIVNSIQKDVLPEVFIPVFKYTNWIRFNPRNTDDPNYDPSFSKGDVIWKSTDPTDPKVIAETKFGPEGEKPAATTFMNFFCWFEGYNMPVVVSFSKTSYKAGKQLLSLAKFSGGDMFSNKYKLTSEIKTGESGTYAVMKIAPAGKVSPEEHDFCNSLWEEFAKSIKDLKVHEEGEAVEDVDFAYGENA